MNEELSRDLGNSQGGVLGTLVHIYQADRIWLSRLKGTPRFTLGGYGRILDARLAGRRMGTNMRTSFSSGYQPPATCRRYLTYKNLAGQEHRLPIWQVVLHVVNHATYHRGQITTMLRQLGYTPIATDLHVFYLMRQ